LYDISTTNDEERKIILHIGTFRRLQARQPIDKIEERKKENDLRTVKIE